MLFRSDGDCLFQSIAQATGYSVQYVQSVFGEWAYQNQPQYYGDSHTSGYVYAGINGANAEGTAWLLGRFGLSQTQTPIGSYYDGSGNGGVMVMYGYDKNGTMYGHSVNFLYGDTNGNYYYYDAQNNVYGSVSAYGGGYWNVMGVYH